jgi:hypothetical protein
MPIGDALLDYESGDEIIADKYRNPYECGLPLVKRDYSKQFDIGQKRAP